MAEETPEVKEETPQTAEERIVEEKKEKHWVKPFLLSIFIIALIAGLVFTVYILGQKGIRLGIVKGPTPTPATSPTLELTPTPEAIPTPTPEPTADWETYTNTKYGYQFKHPRGWIFTPSVVGDETKPLYVIRESLESNNIDDYIISIKTWDNPDRRSLVDWLQFMKGSGALALPAEDVELVSNYTVGGEPAFKIWSDPISKGKEPGKCFQACPVLSVYFTHGNKAFRAEHVYMREVDEASQETFTLLLSTFELLD